MILFHQTILQSLIRYGIQVWYGNLSAQLKAKLAHHEDNREKRKSLSSPSI